MSIKEIGEWTHLVTDPQLSLGQRMRQFLPRAPQLSHPGKDLDQLIQDLVQKTRDRAHGSVTEGVYQESITRVYEHFKARLSQFQVDPAVSKGALLKRIALHYLQPHPATFDLLIQKYCEEEIRAFQLNLTPISTSALDKQMGRIDAAAILKRVNTAITDFTNLYNAPTHAIWKQTEEALYQALSKKHQPFLKEQMGKLEHPDASVQTQFDRAFMADLTQQPVTVEQEREQIEKNYAQTVDKLKESLKTLESHVAEADKQIRQFFIKYNQPLSSSNADLISEANRLLPRCNNSVVELELKQHLKRHESATLAVAAKEQEITQLLQRKKERLASLEKMLSENAIFQGNLSERTSYICTQRLAAKEQYQKLFAAFESASPAPLPVADQKIAAEPTKTRAYSVAVGLGVCAVYYGLYWSMRWLVVSTVFRSNLNATFG